MAYGEITKDQMINGLPVDQTVIKNAIDNQKDIKQQVDLDDDLSALARDIVPAVDDTRDLGTDLLRYAQVFSYLADFNRVIVGQGTMANLSLSFSGDNSTGLYSSSSGMINFRANGYGAFNIDSSKIHVAAANDRQIHIEDTSVGVPGLWSVGADQDGVHFRDLLDAADLKFSIRKDEIQPKKQVQAIDSVAIAPAYAFASESSSGMYWQAGSQSLGLSHLGEVIFDITVGNLRINHDDVTFNDGTDQNPSINFSSSVQTGLSYDTVDAALKASVNGIVQMEWDSTSTVIPSDAAATMVMSTAVDIDAASILLMRRSRGAHGAHTAVQLGDLLGGVSFDGAIDASGNFSDVTAKMCGYAAENFDGVNTGSFLAFEATDVGQNVADKKMEINKPTFPTISMLGSFGAKKALLNVAGAHTEFNIANFSVLKVDTSTGSIILNTLGGGEDTQFLFIFKSDPANSITIKHNDVSTGQKIFTQNQTDLVLGAGYGGATFICDEGDWKEISIS